MITLVCTKCGNTLQVDDGFAGGVCRCSTCGTIQTVPARGERQSAGGQAIFERATRGGKPGSSSKDLEALSEIVTSSGLIGSGMLHHTRHRADAAAAEKARRKRAGLIAVLLGAGVAVLVGLWLAFGAGRPSQKKEAASLAEQPAPIASLSGPSFGPIALDAPGAVIYLVDRGDATRAYTAPLQKAVARSASSLGDKRKFQVRYWNADGETPVFPNAPAEPTPATLAKLGPWMNDVAGGRATDASTSLNDALALAPAEIVILTGKAWQLDDSFANEAIVKLAATKDVRIHGIALGGSSGSDALARVVAKTGGRFIEMGEGELTAIAK